MIERRRLFFRSDFLRDITQPALFRELLCNLHVYYQETMESHLPEQTVIPTARTRPDSDANWPYRNSLTGLVFFATFAFLICYVYQINWDCFRWGHAFRRKRSSRELRARRCS